MKKLILACSIALFAFAASAQTKITPKEASKHVGEDVVLTGKIFGSKFFANNNMTLLDVGGFNPNQDLTVMIAGADRSKFVKPEDDFKGKEVTITGKIIDYKGKPEIIVTDPAQIKIILSDNMVKSVPMN